MARTMTNPGGVRSSWLVLLALLLYSAHLLAVDQAWTDSDEGAALDPESAEGSFDERARLIQKWLQKRELERIDMGLSHHYERPGSVNDDFEDSSQAPSLQGFRKSGRDLYVRLRRPGASAQLHERHSVSKLSRGLRGKSPSKRSPSSAVSRRSKGSGATARGNMNTARKRATKRR